MKRVFFITMVILAALLPEISLGEAGGDKEGADASTDAPGEAETRDAAGESPQHRPGKLASELPPQDRPTIKTWVDHKKIGLGEVVHLHVSIRRRSEHRFRLPQDVAFGKLDLLDKSVETTKIKKSWEEDRYRFELIALESGSVEIPPLRFGGVTKSGEVIYLESRKIELSVRDPTGGKVDPKLKDAAPVVKVYEKNYLPLYFLAIAAGVFLLLLLVWYVARNWEKWHPKAPLAPPPPRPPEEVAYEKLQALRAVPPMDDATKKQWYIDLSEIMREYLANRFDFDALESTSEEIIEFMKQKKTVGVTQAELWKFLVGCDMVKFAKYLGSNEEDKEIIGEAFRIVEATTHRREDGGNDARRAVHMN